MFTLQTSIALLKTLIGIPLGSVPMHSETTILPVETWDILGMGSSDNRRLTWHDFNEFSFGQLLDWHFILVCHWRYKQIPWEKNNVNSNLLGYKKKYYTITSLLVINNKGWHLSRVRVITCNTLIYCIFHLYVVCST